MAPLPDAPAPFRIAFDNARDPYTARNALGITGTGAGPPGPAGPTGPTGPAGVVSATPPLSLVGSTLSIDSSALNTTINCGRLTNVSATALSFKPYNGDRIKINGVVYAILGAGIAGLANTGVFVNGVAGQNLAAGTSYYVYAFNNAGTITADFSVTTHATSATAGNIGVEIKSGDDTRTLIGLIVTNTSAQFADTFTQRFVISWFNRRNLQLLGASTAGAATASGGFVTLGTGSYIEFVTWADETVTVICTGYATNNGGTGFGAQLSAGFDGVASGQIGVAHCYVATAWIALTAITTGTLSEGYHHAQPLGAVVAGATASYYVSAAATVRG